VVVDELPAFFGLATNQSPTSGSWAAAGLRAVENKFADDECVFFTKHFHFDIFKVEAAHMDLVGVVGAITSKNAVVATRDVFADESNRRGLLISAYELVYVSAVPGFGLIVEDFFNGGFFACGRKGKRKSQYKNQSHA